MNDVKQIRVAPIKASDANLIVKNWHYSGSVVPNSQLHFGVYLNGRCGGVMQFGPSTDKRKMVGLVKDTPWNGFIELNRMAFSDYLPRNSESRAISVALRLIRKHYPHIQWVISFADGTQCGDGTIYRASGFHLTGIRENSALIRFPNGETVSQVTVHAHWNSPAVAKLCAFFKIPVKPRPVSAWLELGGVKLKGYQLRYMYFLDPTAKERLTVPILPFSKIAELGAGMYRGQKRAPEALQDAAPHQGDEGG